MSRHQNIREITFTFIAILFVIIFPHIGLMPLFSYVIPVVLFIWLYLKRSGENFADLGFSFSRLSWHAALIGTATGAALFIFLQYIFFPLLTKIIPLSPADIADFASIRHNLPMYLFVVVMGWVIGGIYEEIVFHGFIFTRLEKTFAGNYATIIAVILTTIIFGAYHIQLGTSGVINATLAGLGYHLLMLPFNRNLWYAFFAHGVFDTIALTYIYLGYW